MVPRGRATPTLMSDTRLSGFTCFWLLGKAQQRARSLSVHVVGGVGLDVARELLLRFPRRPAFPRNGGPLPRQLRASSQGDAGNSEAHAGRRAPTEHRGDVLQMDQAAYFVPVFEGSGKSWGFAAPGVPCAGCPCRSCTPFHAAITAVRNNTTAQSTRRGWGPPHGWGDSFKNPCPLLYPARWTEPAPNGRGTKHPLNQRFDRYMQHLAPIWDRYRPSFFQPAPGGRGTRHPLNQRFDDSSHHFGPTWVLLFECIGR
jgi:hypothetical protein